MLRGTAPIVEDPNPDEWRRALVISINLNGNSARASMADRVAESLFDDLADNIDLLTRVLLESGCDKCSDASQALPKIDLPVDLWHSGVPDHEGH